MPIESISKFNRPVGFLQTKEENLISVEIICNLLFYLAEIYLYFNSV